MSWRERPPRPGVLVRESFLAFLYLSCLFLPTASAAGNSSVAANEHFKIICHFENEAVARSALKATQGVWPSAGKIYGPPAGTPQTPLEIHLYRTTQDYETAEAARTGGRFKKNLAFSSHATKSSNIALQPPCSDETLEAVGLPELTRRQIAHEAAHLVCFHTLPNFQSHPDWLSEGSAGWIADRAMKKQGRIREAEDDPLSATEMSHAKQLLASQRLPSISQIIRDEIADVGFYERYAVQSLYFRFMMTGDRAKRFRAVLEQARMLGGGPQYRERLIASFEKTFGEEGLTQVDRKFREYVKSFSPRWREVYRSLETRGAAWTQIAFEEKNALAWRTRRVGKREYTLTGSVEILPNTKRQMNLLLGHDDGNFVSISVTAGFGVNVFRYRAKEDKWDELARAANPLIETGKRIDFAVKSRMRKPVADQPSTVQIEVLIDGRTVLTADLGDFGLTGPWGLGAQAGSAGIWRKVRVQAKAAEPTGDG